MRGSFARSCRFRRFPFGFRRPAWAARSRCARRGVVAILEQAFRDQWGSLLIGFLGDFDLAEEAAQEAFAVAAERWPRDGAPANKGPGW